MGTPGRVKDLHERLPSCLAKAFSLLVKSSDACLSDWPSSRKTSPLSSISPAVLSVILPSTHQILYSRENSSSLRGKKQWMLCLSYRNKPMFERFLVSVKKNRPERRLVFSLTGLTQRAVPRPRRRPRSYLHLARSQQLIPRQSAGRGCCSPHI